jgi:hypothetical protein
LRLALQGPLHELSDEFRSLRLIRHALLYLTIVSLAGWLGADDPAVGKLHGGLRFPGTVRSVIAVNDGHSGGIWRRLAGR